MPWKCNLRVVWTRLGEETTNILSFKKILVLEEREEIKKENKALLEIVKL